MSGKTCLRLVEILGLPVTNFSGLYRNVHVPARTITNVSQVTKQHLEEELSGRSHEN